MQDQPSPNGTGPGPSPPPLSGLFGGPPSGGGGDAIQLISTHPKDPSWALRGNVLDHRHRGFMLRRMAHDMALKGAIDWPTLMFYDTMFTAAVSGKSRDEYLQAVTMERRAKMAMAGPYARYDTTQQSQAQPA